MAGKGKPKGIELSPQESVDFRDQLRSARAAALQDAEGFQEILFAVERLGSFLWAREHGYENDKGSLGEYAHLLGILASKTPLSERSSFNIGFLDRFEQIRLARNDAMHQGAFARNFTAQLVELALMLEDALMKDWPTIDCFMVRNPVCASAWHPLGFARQVMLRNSFSFLPLALPLSVEDEKQHETDQKKWKWNLVSDFAIASLLAPLSPTDRKATLRQSIKELVDSGKLKIVEAPHCLPTTTVREAIERLKVVEHPSEKQVRIYLGCPILVYEHTGPEQLLGIATSFDLM